MWNAIGAAWSLVGAWRDREKIKDFIKKYHRWILGVLAVAVVMRWWLG